MSRPLLLFGATGQVGGALLEAWREGPYGLLAPSRDEVDVRDAAAAELVAAEKPFAVVNAAAYTDVDGAEADEASATAVNAAAPAAIAAACARAGAVMLHFSTDYVFNGRSERPWLESDRPAPLNAYGRSKAEGEAAVRQALRQHIILRTSWVFSARRRNFVTTMLRLARERDDVDVVCDQFACPTSAASLARAVAQIVARAAAGEALPWGLYHLCGAGKISRFGFATAIFDIANPYLERLPNLNSIASDAFPVAAARPPYSVLDCSLIEKRLGLAGESWRPDLARVVKQILTGEATA